MSAQRVNDPIRSWEEGDNVLCYALLVRKELRTDKNGREFLNLELRDASGSIAAKVWSDNGAAIESTPEVHHFVKIKGAVTLYNKQLQLKIERCREATEQDKSDGFDEARLVPSTREDIDDLWARLERIYSGGSQAVRRPVLRRLATETISVWGAQLREHPAASSIHHAYRGGLLEHVVSMAELGEKICAHYPDVDQDLVLLGVLFHDLGKILELGKMPVNEYTEAGRLVGHVVIGRDMLLERCAAIPEFPSDLRLHLEHLVLSHQGQRDFGAPVVPMSAEAFVLHFIDDLDSKINQLRAERDAGPGFRYHRPTSRYLYFPAEAARIIDLPAEELGAAPAGEEPSAEQESAVLPFGETT